MPTSVIFQWKQWHFWANTCVKSAANYMYTWAHQRLNIQINNDQTHIKIELRLTICYNKSRKPSSNFHGIKLKQPFLLNNWWLFWFSISTSNTGKNRKSQICSPNLYRMPHFQSVCLPVPQTYSLQSRHTWKFPFSILQSYYTLLPLWFSAKVKWWCIAPQL